MLITQNPFPQFFDAAGKPLSDGRIYFGVAGQNPRTSPVAIYTDAAGTQPIAQPVRTLGGYPVRNGSPVNIYTPGTYSVAVYTASGTLVAYAPDSAAFDSVLSATTAFTRSLLDDPDAATARTTLGAASLGANTFTGAQTLPGNATNPLEAVPLQQVASALSFSGLTLSATGTNTNVTVGATELLLRGADGSPRLVSGINLTLNIAVSGANGLDTGALASSTWYAVWVISNGTTTAALASLSSTAPTMPSGYTHKARVGWIRTDGTANKWPLAFRQAGRRVRYSVAGNVTGLPAVIVGVQGNTSTPTWVAASVSAFVPPTAAVVALLLTGSTNSVSMAAPSNAYGAYNSTTNPPPMELSNSAASRATTTYDMVLESASVYYASLNASDGLYATGWEDNL